MITPWCAELVPDIEPLVVRIQPGQSITITGDELASHAGLPEVHPFNGMPLPGHLAGLVVLSEVRAQANVRGTPWGAQWLRAKQHECLTLHAGCRVELMATSRSGTCSIWVCRAVEKVMRPSVRTGLLVEHLNGVLRDASAALDALS